MAKGSEQNDHDKLIKMETTCELTRKQFGEELKGIRDYLENGLSKRISNAILTALNDHMKYGTPLTEHINKVEEPKKQKNLGRFQFLLNDSFWKYFFRFMATLCFMIVMLISGALGVDITFGFGWLKSILGIP